MSRIITNTNLLREPALHFLKNGYYFDAPEGTRAWKEHWEEEKRRIEQGYSVGGLHITGAHYFYLNYCQIERTEDTVSITGQKGVTKIHSFPAFWDGDFNYFWAVEIARHGIDPKKYDQLGLEINIAPEDLAGGKHLVVLKARGKGYSYKNAAMMARIFNTMRHKKAFAMAFEKEYLIKDGLLNKTWDTIAFLDANTPFRQPRLKDTEMLKKSGYKKVIGGSEIEMGTRNEIVGVTLKDDPDKARGKRGELILFEEAGKFPGLLKAWQVSRPSVEQGAFTTGIQIAFGTGGTEDADYEALKQMFYNPKTYRVLAMENIWEEHADGILCSFFVPSFQNWEGYIDEDGNSDTEGAKEYHEAERENQKLSSDPRAIEQYVCEHPFTPREATLQTTQNLFPTIAIQEQLNSVEGQRRHLAATNGVLYRNSEGEVKFRFSEKRTPVWEHPVKRGQDTKGAVTIWEAPYRGSGGKPPRGMYILGHDPYAHDKAEGGSLGAAYVLKRDNPLSKSLPSGIVASWVARPDSQDEYNEQLFLLAEYYNCKIGFENDRGEVAPYAKRFKLLHYLEEEFEMLDKKELQSKTVSRPYGMHMTEQRKLQGEMYIRDWLKTPVTFFPDGSPKLLLHTILDPGLLKELLTYHRDGNFDRVMAIMISMYYLKEMHNAEVVVAEPDYMEFFNRDLFR